MAIDVLQQTALQVEEDDTAEVEIAEEEGMAESKMMKEEGLGEDEAKEDQMRAQLDAQLLCELEQSTLVLQHANFTRKFQQDTNATWDSLQAQVDCQLLSELDRSFLFLERDSPAEVVAEQLEDGKKTQAPQAPPAARVPRQGDMPDLQRRTSTRAPARNANLSSTVKSYGQDPHSKVSPEQGFRASARRSTRTKRPGNFSRNEERKPSGLGHLALSLVEEQSAEDQPMDEQTAEDRMVAYQFAEDQPYDDGWWP